MGKDIYSTPVLAEPRGARGSAKIFADTGLKVHGTRVTDIKNKMDETYPPADTAQNILRNYTYVIPIENTFFSGTTFVAGKVFAKRCKRGYKECSIVGLEKRKTDLFSVLAPRYFVWYLPRGDNGDHVPMMSKIKLLSIFSLYWSADPEEVAKITAYTFPVFSSDDEGTAAEKMDEWVFDEEMAVIDENLEKLQKAKRQLFPHFKSSNAKDFEADPIISILATVDMSPGLTLKPEMNFFGPGFMRINSDESRDKSGNWVTILELRTRRPDGNVGNVTMERDYTTVYFKRNRTPYGAEGDILSISYNKELTLEAFYAKWC